MRVEGPEPREARAVDDLAVHPVLLLPAVLQKQGIFIGLMSSDRKLKTSRNGSK